MVNTLFQCNECGKIGGNKSEMEKHENIPTTGFDLKPGELYGHEYRGKRKLNTYYMIKDKIQMDPDHERQYSFLTWKFNPSGNKWNFKLSQSSNINYFRIYSSYFKCLDEKEFEEIKGILEGDETPAILKEYPLKRGTLEQIAA